VRYARNPTVLWRSTSQGPVLLAVDDEAPTRLHGLAAVVWEVLDQPLDADALRDEVADLLHARPDLTPCLDELVARALVVPQPD
jgi:hypothetical protein